MPRKTKEQKELENKTEKVTKKASTKKESVISKNTSTKKSTTTVTKKTTNTKKGTTKAASTTKKKPSTTAKKAPIKNKTTTTKKPTTKKNSSPKKKIDIVEYYDLPYRYNQTVIKVLAQTPTNLFIYWDISDADRKNLKKQYGDDFFETTKPILIVYNDTLGYHFEIEINDFANSWYLHVADSKCDYRIELGRRPIVKTEKLDTDYIYITTSNEIESPNDRILLDNHQKMVYFRDIKTGIQTEKEITNISFIRNMGKIYDIYDLGENHNVSILSNPSSGSMYQ